MLFTLANKDHMMQKRLEKLTACGDPLIKLNDVMDWRIFMPVLEKSWAKQKKNNAGRKPYPALMMFKILILQSLYNLSDHQAEYQIRDRLSFCRFLGLRLGDETPDEKTIWQFREMLKNAGAIEKLFDRFDRYLGKSGFDAKTGTIIDASIISAPKQRNNREDNQLIKEGKIPEGFKNNVYRLRQKDIDARWTQKNQQNYYGYKNHIAVDAKHKLIRKFKITSAHVADIQCLDYLLCSENEGKQVWADSAYYSVEKETWLKEQGYESRVIKRNRKHLPVWSNQSRENTRRSKIRARVEHVFGFMENSMGGKLVRGIGLARVKAKIGLRNLVYNLFRYEQIVRLGVA